MNAGIVSGPYKEYINEVIKDIVKYVSGINGRVHIEDYLCVKFSRLNDG